jgi:hypothetical protein
VAASNRRRTATPVISGDIERLNKSLPIFMGLRFLIDLLAKTNLVSTKKIQLNELNQAPSM